ncbi:MAG: MMPL family transporter, partial [Acetatifactor sp.]|nr:MMPL family transporter [Acetatifactor sp.]
MKKTAAFLVNRRHILLCFFLLLAAISLPLAGRVRINYDLSQYLPADSRMKQGMRLMEQEFGPSVSSQLRVMFRGLTEEEKSEAHRWLSGLEQATEVLWEPGEEYNRGGCSLFELTTEYDAHSKEAAALYRAVHDRYDGFGVLTGGSIHEANVPLLPLHMVIIAVGLVFLILLAMCNSWFEPVVFMVNIGIAVAVNLGTNVIFSGISEYTNSIVGIMQLVLSMDYSIILMTRYTQEKEKAADNPSAMKAAIAAAFPAVAGSSLTTFAGLVCLALMRFRLGADMGFALAKSVFVSLVCIFTVLPSLILMSDRWIVKTRKKALKIPMGGYAGFVSKHRIAFAALFLALFLSVFFLKDNTEILYTLEANNPVDQVFAERHSLALLYEAGDGDKIAEVMAPFEKDDQVTGITGYYNTLGKAYRAEELSELFGDAAGKGGGNTMNMLYQFYASQNGYDQVETLTLGELIPFIQERVLENPLFSRLIDDGTRQQIAQAGEMLRENTARLVGERYGRVILTTVYPEDSAETRAFLKALRDRCDRVLDGDSWLIGASAMNEEMSRTFDSELTRITVFSAIAIFLVVALTFRSLLIPLALVMTVQCGIYLTMTFIQLSGGGMFYLALLMVQCILMGATIDYGILYTTYYLESGPGENRRTALRKAYDGGLHTIMTSALIVIVAAGILGFVFANPAIGEICLTISRGAISATLLIVFILPGVLAALDRFVRRGKGSG